jgi:DUF4097 and DUF4098 domain-containing protein YvlB
MPRISLRSTILCACVAVLASALTVNAQDFQKNYSLTAGGSVAVKNVSGNVNIKGSDVSGVSVAVFKEGPDRDKVEVEDLSSANRVELHAKYPQDCRCNASLRFEISVPRSLNINIDRITIASGDVNVDGVTGKVAIRTASGDVKASNVNGEVDASTASGEVSVTNVVGTVNARSASGNVQAEIAGLQGGGDMKFSSASGDVKVTMPSNIDADVRMTTTSGSINTDFPLQVKKHEYGPGSEATGRLGAGSRNIQISSASGDVSLTHQ